MTYVFNKIISLAVGQQKVTVTFERPVSENEASFGFFATALVGINQALHTSYRQFLEQFPMHLEAEHVSESLRTLQAFHALLFFHFHCVQNIKSGTMIGWNQTFGVSEEFPEVVTDFLKKYNITHDQDQPYQQIGAALQVFKQTFAIDTSLTPFLSSLIPSSPSLGFSGDQITTTHLATYRKSLLHLLSLSKLEEQLHRLAPAQALGLSTVMIQTPTEALKTFETVLGTLREQPLNTEPGKKLLQEGHTGKFCFKMDDHYGVVLDSKKKNNQTVLLVHFPEHRTTDTCQENRYVHVYVEPDGTVSSVKEVNLSFEDMHHGQLYKSKQMYTFDEHRTRTPKIIPLDQIKLIPLTRPDSTQNADDTIPVAFTTSMAPQPLQWEFGPEYAVEADHPVFVVQQGHFVVIQHNADQQQMPVVVIQKETSPASSDTDESAPKIRKKSPQKFSTINQAKLNRLKKYLTQIDKTKGMEWYTDIYRLSSDRSIDRIIQVLVPILTPGQHARMFIDFILNGTGTLQNTDTLSKRSAAFSETNWNRFSPKLVEVF